MLAARCSSLVRTSCSSPADAVKAIQEAVQRCSSGRNSNLLCAGTICPAQGKLAKASGKKVACFGPVTGWHICCDGAQPEVCVLLLFWADLKHIHTRSCCVCTPAQIACVPHCQPDLQAYAISSAHAFCLAAQVRLRTENGEYMCSRAAASYRTKFQHLQEQVAVLHEVSSPSSSARQLQLSCVW